MSFKSVLPKHIKRVDQIIVGTCAFVGRTREKDFIYSFPPLSATKARIGNAKANKTIGSINAFDGNGKLALIKAKIESKSIIAKLKNAVPQCEYMIFKKKFPIFLSKIQHLTFGNYHFNGNIVRFVRNGIQNERGI
jgi:hypothetical protein